MYDAAQWLEELHRVVGSRTFARAPLLRLLATWLVEQVCHGRHDLLNEYDAALYLRNRSDHDPAVQSDVRKLLSRLRQKLTSYYSGEGRDSAWELRFPGGFEPRLLPRLPRRCATLRPLLYFAGVHPSPGADPAPLHYFEASLLWEIGAGGLAQVVMIDTAKADFTLKGAAWGSDPVLVTLQVSGRPNGLLLAQARVAIQGDPSRSAQRALHKLELTELLDRAAAQGKSGERHALA